MSALNDLQNQSVPDASQSFLLTTLELNLWASIVEMSCACYHLRGDSISPCSSVLNSSLNFTSFHLQPLHHQIVLHQPNLIYLDHLLRSESYQDCSMVQTPFFVLFQPRVAKSTQMILGSQLLRGLLDSWLEVIRLRCLSGRTCFS